MLPDFHTSRPEWSVNQSGSSASSLMLRFRSMFLRFKTYQFLLPRLAMAAWAAGSRIPAGCGRHLAPGASARKRRSAPSSVALDKADGGGCADACLVENTLQQQLTHCGDHHPDREGS